MNDSKCPNPECENGTIFQREFGDYPVKCLERIHGQTSKCPTCGGSGKWIDPMGTLDEVDCPTCNGTGQALAEAPTETADALQKLGTPTEIVEGLRGNIKPEVTQNKPSDLIKSEAPAIDYDKFFEGERTIELPRGHGAAQKPNPSGEAAEPLTAEKWDAAIARAKAEPNPVSSGEADPVKNEKLWLILCTTPETADGWQKLREWQLEAINRLITEARIDELEKLMVDSFYVGYIDEDNDDVGADVVYAKRVGERLRELRGTL